MGKNGLGQSLLKGDDMAERTKAEVITTSRKKRGTTVTTFNLVVRNWNKDNFSEHSVHLGTFEESVMPSWLSESFVNLYYEKEKKI